MATLGHAPDRILDEIVRQLKQAGPGQKTATMHWLMFRHSADLDQMSGDDFCHRVGLLPSYATEFNKMIRLGRIMREQGFALTEA